MATSPLDEGVTPEMRANQARMLAILRRQEAEHEAKGPERAAELEKVRAAIAKIEASWQPTALE